MFEKNFEFNASSLYNEIPSHKAFQDFFRRRYRNDNTVRDKKFVDIGGGTGEFADWINKSFQAEVVVLEPSDDGVEIARNRYPSIHVEQIVPYSIWEDQNATDKERIFVSLEVIEHCFSPQEFLTTIFKSMSSGEILILSTPYHGYFKNLIISIFNLWDRHFTVWWENGHIKFFSIKSLSQMLKKTNFEIEEISLYGRFRPLSRGMIFVCRKP